MAYEGNELRLNNDEGRKREGNPSCSEYGLTREFPESGKPQRVSEFPEEKTAPPRKAPQKITVLQRVMVAAVAVVAVVVYDLVGIMPETGARVREYSIEAYESGIFYWMELEDYTPEEALSVEVYNDFVRYSQTVEDSFVHGEVNDLKPGMTYTFEVRSGSNVLLRKKVTTQAPDPSEEPFVEPYETQTEEPQQTAEPEQTAESEPMTEPNGQDDPNGEDLSWSDGPETEPIQGGDESEETTDPTGAYVTPGN